MSHILEQEIKLQLNADTHQRLLIHLSQACGASQLQTQENYFFDSPDQILRQHLMSLRLRKQNQGVLLTIKQRRDTNALVHSQDEHEVAINSACWQTMIQPEIHLNDFLPIPGHCQDILAGRHLIPLTHFSNQRWHFTDGSHELCLDHCVFPGSIQEYELEIESPDIEDAGNKWLPLLKQWGYPEIAQTQSKLERCFHFARTELVSSEINVAAP